MKIIAGVLTLLVSGIALFSYVRLAHEKPAPRPTEKVQIVEQMERGVEQARLNVKPIEDRFVDGVRRASAVVLYEGLPHQRFEKGLMEQEKRTKRVRDIQGFPFYVEKLELKDEDAKRLTALLSDVGRLGSILSPDVQKKCGGFHPDYALEWSNGNDRVQAQICFGCGDVRLFSSGSYSERDLSKKARASLEEILKGYRKNRPLKEDPAAASSAEDSKEPTKEEKSADPGPILAEAEAFEKAGDFRQAVSAYRRAYRAGSGKAAVRLGDIYIDGKAGVPRDYASSLVWYDRAQKRGETVERKGNR